MDNAIFILFILVIVVTSLLFVYLRRHDNLRLYSCSSYEVKLDADGREVVHVNGTHGEKYIFNNNTNYNGTDYGGYKCDGHVFYDIENQTILPLVSSIPFRFDPAKTSAFFGIVSFLILSCYIHAFQDS